MSLQNLPEHYLNKYHVGSGALIVIDNDEELDVLICGSSNVDNISKYYLKDVIEASATFY